MELSQDAKIDSATKHAHRCEVRENDGVLVVHQGCSHPKTHSVWWTLAAAFALLLASCGPGEGDVVGENLTAPGEGALPTTVATSTTLSAATQRVAATPMFTPVGGTYTSTQSVTISDATAGAAIYYTVNGTTPTTSSTRYTGSISVAATTTIKAMAVASGYTKSAVASATYTIQVPPPVAAMPGFTPGAGTYTSTQSVTISDATSGATIYYTLDGTTPTTSSTQYAGPINVAATTTINAMAVASGFTSSVVASATYTIQSSPGGSGGGALGPYTFIKLVRDPVRPVLYGLDANQGFVVFISQASLSATKQIAVGANATDLSVDPAGAAIYVGNSVTTGIGRIDPVTGTFQTLSSPRIAYEVRGMASGTVASVDGDSWTSVTLQDGTSGNVLTALENAFYEGALATAADGSALFIGESQMMGGNISRYALQSGSLVQTSNSFNVNNGFGFAYSARIVTSLADGSGVYFGGYFINGTDLNQLVYELSDQPLTVTPDARLAISSSNVYAVSSGALLGALPFTSSVQAASADSRTLYLVNGRTISTVDLAAY
jgi:hypothetical protein